MKQGGWIRRYGCLSAVLVVLVGCSPEPEAPLARPVKLAYADLTGTAGLVQYVGTVWAKSESTPGFRVAGKVRQRLVDPGARVDKGQVLMRLDQADLVLALNSARANRDRAEAEWRLAEVELERFRDLRDKRFVSETEFDRALLAERRAHALFEQADSELSLARNRLAYTELVATGDGTVTEVFVDVGDVVEAGAPVARIALDGARDFVVDVPESQRNWVSASPASITLWALGERRFNASLRELGAAADPVTRTYRARFSIEADDAAIEIGQTGVLRLTLPERGMAVAVPSAALIPRDEGHGVWVYDPEEGVMRSRGVEIVGVLNNDVLVTGLAPGEQYAVAGVHVISEGQPARPMALTSTGQ
ncbi:MAG: efflux RND transporter periplasmic adaptor subunit [Gammaproteobacteria bacterium HGW-Gammaproteobacteria-8]|jgi:RND family efflux transporter MFP subunit|nr:efflux RND transporter periplasmic adaptor subunit [Alcanivoracaceae bacterium]PKL95254.1 MAG: efflux RND transporter periplasmic adaptor subunit [Gammaproteobacteria bacterium HGW-Gammaproteobacteria-8]